MLCTTGECGVGGFMTACIYITRYMMQIKVASVMANPPKYALIDLGS